MKKEHIILFVLILALSIYLITGDKNRSSFTLPDVPKVSTDEINRLELSGVAGDVSIKKKGAEWRIGDKEYLADEVAVKHMLDSIKNFTLTALASESGNYARYGLSEDKKVTVKAYEGDELKMEFDVGKPAPSNRHNFVKLPDNKNIYQANESIRSIFEKKAEELRDTLVLSFNKTEIDEITVFARGKSINLTLRDVPVKAKDDKDPSSKSVRLWISDQGTNPKTEQIDKLLVSLMNLNCQKFINGMNKSDFGDPIFSVDLKGATDEYSIKVFNKDGEKYKGYPAVSSMSDYPFEIPDWIIGDIILGTESFFEQEVNK